MLILGLLGPLAVVWAKIHQVHTETVDTLFRSEMGRRADTIASGMRDPIWNLIPASGMTLAESILKDDHVVGLEVFSEAQGEFLKAGEIGTRRPGISTLKRDVTFDGNKIGSVVLYVDSTKKDSLVSAKKWQFFLLGAAQVITSFIVVLIVIKLQGLLQRAEALRASETRFREIASSAPGVVYQLNVDAKGQVSFPFVSATIKDLLGLDAQEVMEDPKKWLDLANSSDRARWNSSIAESQRRAVPWHWEGRFTRASGETRWFRTSATPRPRGDGSMLWNGMLLDVTDQKEIEGALRESEGRLRGVFEHSPSAITLKDLDGKYQFVNPKFLEWYLPPGSQAIGKKVEDFFAPPYGDTYAAQDREVIATGRAIEIETEIPFADGMLHTIIITKFPVYGAAGQPVGIGTITTDVTEHRRTENALRQAQKMEAVGQLTGGVAHDFNNLLATILGNLELLQDDIGEHRSIATIDRAVRRGAELTQRLLAFSRRQTLQPKSIRLPELIGGLRDLLQRTLGEQITIKTDVASNVWPVTADPGQLENALLNLAINARDAMPDGGVLEITCENKAIGFRTSDVLQLAAPGDFVEICVRDSGHGMPDEVRKQAFEPFFTTKDVGQGSGLGLSMVYGFVRQSGGDILIESEPDQGTAIRLYLPRAENVVATEEVEHKPEFERGTGDVILVLEDEYDVRKFVVMALERLGYRVLAAADPESAMKILEMTDRLDLLLSDVVLPGGVSGPEFAVAAKKRHPNLKLLFMTGYAAEAHMDGELLEASETTLKKPFRTADLASAVYGVLTS